MQLSVVAAIPELGRQLRRNARPQRCALQRSAQGLACCYQALHLSPGFRPVSSRLAKRGIMFPATMSASSTDGLTAAASRTCSPCQSLGSALCGSVAGKMQNYQSRTISPGFLNQVKALEANRTLQPTKPAQTHPTQKNTFVFVTRD